QRKRWIYRSRCRLMKFTLAPIWLYLFFMLLPLLTRAQGNKLLETPYQPSFKEGRLDAFFDDIRARTGVALSFSASFLNTTDIIRLSGTEQTIGEVLSVLL